MALLVLGLSHRSAPMELLDKVSMGASGIDELGDSVLSGGYVNGVAVLSTCNRLEILADVSAFHGGLADIGTALVETVGVDWTVLSPHLFVHYDAAAIEHLFHVACGLDSMALGEGQILGQVRAALSRGQSRRELSSELGDALQQALRVGKRAHAETGLDKVARSLLDTALDSAPGTIGDLRSARALVVGAGAMSGLAVAGLARRELGRITVINRTLASAERLAASVGARAVPLDEENLRRELRDADLVISCTGSTGIVIDAELLGEGDEPTFFVDLAVPRDVADDVRDVPGAVLVNLEDLSERFAQAPHRQGSEVTEVIADVRAIVAEELEATAAKRSARSIAPTVAALHGRAREVLELEISRLNAKLDVDDHTLGEIHTAMRRVAEKILHTPTVRVKELAAEPGGVTYAEALSTLFDLPSLQNAPKTSSGNIDAGKVVRRASEVHP